MDENERKGQVWLAFASAAIAGMAGLDPDELEDDLSVSAADLADEMLEEYESRFGTVKPKKPRKRRVNDN